jgi:hypothetical protein
MFDSNEPFSDQIHLLSTASPAPRSDDIRAANGPAGPSRKLESFESLFKGGLARLGVLGVMLGAGRQLAQAHGAQFAAQRLLADRNAKFLEHPVRQIDISSS